MIFIFNQWKNGFISNFEYLMHLNNLANRKFGDPDLHPILPWVIDFSINPSILIENYQKNSNNTKGWRDLTKSKCRITKGFLLLKKNLYNSN